MIDNSSSLLDPRFLARLEQLSLISKRIIAGQTQGQKRSSKRGSSVEFADYREYALGDDLRYVDWKAYGRLEKLFLKLFVEEEDLSLHLLLDTSKSMDFGAPLTKAHYALRVAAALGYIALSDYDRVSVATFGSTLGNRLPPLRGKPGIGPFFRFLQDNTTVGVGTGFGTALTEYAARAKNIGIAVVISDFFDESYERGLKALLARRFQIVLIHVLDTEEVAPSLGGDVRLVDSETAAWQDASLSPYLLGQYAQRFNAFIAGLQAFSSRYGIDYVRAVTTVPFEDVILKFLRTQSVLR